VIVLGVVAAVGLLLVATPLGGAAQDLVLPRNSVGTEQIRANAVTRGKIRNNNVTREKLAQRAVNTPQLANNAVGSAQLANGAVGVAQLAPLPAADVTSDFARPCSRTARLSFRSSGRSSTRGASTRARIRRA
jgi:hypothetical protein